MAETYFNLSTNARDQKDNEAAEEWLRKTLHIFEKTSDVRRAVRAGEMAEQAGEFGVAENLYQGALEIAKKKGNEEYEAYSYQYLGHLACQQCDYEASKKWYEKALKTYEKRGAVEDAAKTCTSLGNLCLANIAGKQRDFASAKKWFRKALEIDDNATWRDWVTLYARLWFYKSLSLFSK